MIDMSENNVICTNCGTLVEGNNRFCTNCGTPIQAPRPSPPPEPTLPPQPAPRLESAESLIGELKAKLKVVENKAGDASQKAKGVITPERASEAVKNMLSVMTQVARDVKRDLPQDMVNAVDLTAEINLIAFSIGVSIDLDQLRANSTPALPKQGQ